MKYKNVVWDWNGTLLDDLEIGVRTLNCMLEKRGLTVLTTQRYKDLFGFPVVGFYENVGFDFQRETMHEMSVDFVETYDRFAGGMSLTAGAKSVLANIRETGTKQYILSALREDLLKQMVEDFGIKECFDQVCGSDNIYAAGKIERGQRMVEKYGIRPHETLMVGDTIHDAEVADALGFDCILYTGGHNSEWRLKQKASVIPDLKRLIEIL